MKLETEKRRVKVVDESTWEGAICLCIYWVEMFRSGGGAFRG